MIQAEEKYMKRAIELAQLGAGAVSPNPMVGAVIVHRGKIIGEGYHQKYGEPHAEVNAINSVLFKYPLAEELLRESEIYVTLEPCAHHGKTPPCADLIIRYGIPHVITGSPDPFSLVNGKGIEKLREAGIYVTENILRRECDIVNRRFLTRIREHRPYIILKWAQTADHFFAPADGTQKWITSLASRMLVHRWRSEEDAVLVGKNTALTDNPRLNVRDWTGRDPKRIVIDRHLELPADLHLFDQSQETMVFNSQKTETHGSVKYLWLEDFDHYLPQMLTYQLYLMDIQSVIIEGGAKVLDLFIKAGLWDEARIFTSQQHWGEGIKSPEIRGLSADKTDSGPDTLEILMNTKSRLMTELFSAAETTSI